MSLIRDIQAATVAPNVDITNLLRMCKLLAARISHQQLADWADRELNGYPNVDSLPEYRTLEVLSYGRFVGHYKKAEALQIPIGMLPERLHAKYQNAHMGQAISVYAGFDLTGTGSLREPWDVSVALKYASPLVPDTQCVEAWKEIPFGAIHRLLDAVKTRILGYVIDLEREAPNAGETPIGSQPPVSRERMTQIFNTNIAGNVGNVANASNDFTQTSTAGVPAEDWQALVARLQELGLTSDDMENMQPELN